MESVMRNEAIPDKGSGIQSDPSNGKGDKGQERKPTAAGADDELVADRSRLCGRAVIVGASG